MTLRASSLIFLASLGLAHGFFSLSFNRYPSQNWYPNYYPQEIGAQYCRRNVDDCLGRLCNALRGDPSKVNCENHASLRSQLRNRMLNCYGDLNECVTRSPLITCYHGNDNQCHRYSSCVNGQCYWNSIVKYCSSSYDCNNSQYECRDNECHLLSNNNHNYWYWSSWNPVNSNFNPNDNPENYDGYTGMACSLNSHCRQFQTCAFGQCWSAQLMRECQSDSDCPHRHVYYCSWKRCKAR